MFDMPSRWEQWRALEPDLRLYAVVDGLQYQTLRGQRLEAGTHWLALFTGTPDAPLAHAGPWLVDAGRAGEYVTDELANLEREAPALIWLIASQDLQELGQVLRQRLNVRLPDKRVGLLRFWDARVLVDLVCTLDEAQREEFFGATHEWHLLHEGQRVWIGRRDADAH